LCFEPVHVSRDTCRNFRRLRPGDIRPDTISLIGYGVGLAGAGAGLVLLLTAPRESQPAASRGPRFDLSLGDGSVAIGASGRFR
jgi:hypothetical protein